MSRDIENFNNNIRRRIGIDDEDLIKKTMIIILTQIIIKNNKFTIILQRRRVAIVNISRKELVKVLNITDRSSKGKYKRIIEF